ncbi:MAG: DUF3536 domain-containing protein [Elusimicrobia bacterium]|nr:DUF3536 domain-containing protein [Elusimicrobiota bacterium]
MPETRQAKKCLAVHAHFYQPPRENPWTGEPDFDPSAYPYDNWNRRISRECYIPNLYARITDNAGKIIEAVNNYEYLNFDFGPTLLNWLEKEYPFIHEQIVNTVGRIKDSSGHPNAIAQAYNHIIMPLASFQDQVTQIVWGIKDFEYRFGFRPEAMWLPETAVNEDTLRLLIDHGMKYVILSPHQAEKIKSPETNKWTDVSNGSIDPKKPYAWRDRDAEGNRIKHRSIAVFFYDAGISGAVSFEDALKNSENFVRRISLCYTDPTRDQLVLIAADGESYGHHHKFADMTIAHAFRHELKKYGIETTSLSLFLSDHKPHLEVELKKGPDGEGASWSCFHGVRRWKGGCECGKEKNFHLNWRHPLRAAMNWLRDALYEIYKVEAAPLFRDVWQARNDYINLMIDRSEENFNSFFSRNSERTLERAEKIKAVKLLEMQKNSMYMFTSCGWFFSDISRIEAVQNLKYAAKAVETAEDLGYKGLEKGFLSLLETAPSNFTSYGNGRNSGAAAEQRASGSSSVGRYATRPPCAASAANGLEIYERLVISSVPSLEHIFAAFLIRTIYQDKEFPYLYGYVAGFEKLIKKNMSAAGILNLRNKTTGEEFRKTFACLSETATSLPAIYLSKNDAQKVFENAVSLLDADKTPQAIKGFTAVDLQTLPFSEKLSVFKLVSRNIQTKHRAAFESAIEEHFLLMEHLSGNGFEPGRDPADEIKRCAKYLINSYLNEFIHIREEAVRITHGTCGRGTEPPALDEPEARCSGRGAAVPALLEKIIGFSEKLTKHGIKVQIQPEAETLLKFLKILIDFKTSPTAENLKMVGSILEISKMLRMDDLIFHIQNFLIDISRNAGENQEFIDLSEKISEKAGILPGKDIIGCAG